MARVTSHLTVVVEVAVAVDYLEVEVVGNLGNLELEISIFLIFVVKS